MLRFSPYFFITAASLIKMKCIGQKVFQSSLLPYKSNFNISLRIPKTLRKERKRKQCDVIDLDNECYIFSQFLGMRDIPITVTEKTVYGPKTEGVESCIIDFEEAARRKQYVVFFHFKLTQKCFQSTYPINQFQS